MNVFFVTLALSFVVLLLVITGMSLGVIGGRKPIGGSCGGLNGPDGCGLCGASDRGKRCDRRGGGQ